MNSATFLIKVGGDYACFTNPGLKVERCTYPVMTPAAARGVLEAIYWKPQFRWEIRGIKVLKPIKQISIMRNEIKDRQSEKPIVIEQKKQRQQRTSLILKDVEYVIAAEIVLREGINNIKGYSEQFKRKLERGQCHHTPYLGTREFAAWFEPATGKEEPNEFIKELSLGQMLFDTAYRENNERKEIDFHRHKGEEKWVSRGYAHALFFDAAIKDNVLNVPREKYFELYELEGVHV
ncbi:MAG: CRISPR-associated protein Cas5 [Candidatus Scalindua rubra]|uniref:pre-crRNA processing endonuclease n=1 Tax=Candidatus Scalindua rubra TaxID=1872076 RepID=A0A1E3XEI7_9BACT|nr:MAG: CRISPR-associated protein Cas5 [Candidatus Scalindua rubra]